MCVIMVDFGDYSFAQVFAWLLGTSLVGDCQNNCKPLDKVDLITLNRGFRFAKQPDFYIL